MLILGFLPYSMRNTADIYLYKKSIPNILVKECWTSNRSDWLRLLSSGGGEKGRGWQDEPA